MAQDAPGPDNAGMQTNIDIQGWTVLPGLLAPDQCATLVGLYDAPNLFRSQVVMARHGFGRGEFVLTEQRPRMQSRVAVLRPFAMSFELALPILIVVDPVMSMLRAMLNVAIVSAITALAAGRQKQEDDILAPSATLASAG